MKRTKKVKVYATKSPVVSDDYARDDSKFKHCTLPGCTSKGKAFKVSEAKHKHAH